MIFPGVGESWSGKRGSDGLSSGRGGERGGTHQLPPDHAAHEEDARHDHDGRGDEPEEGVAVGGDGGEAVEVLAEVAYEEREGLRRCVLLSAQRGE